MAKACAASNQVSHRLRGRTAQFEIRPGQHLLNIGSRLGRASRYFVYERGCLVTGIDLAKEYVSTAEVLAKHVRLENRVSYRHGSALDLPFAPGSFDGGSSAILCSYYRPYYYGPPAYYAPYGWHL